MSHEDRSYRSTRCSWDFWLWSRLTLRQSLRHGDQKHWSYRVWESVSVQCISRSQSPIWQKLPCRRQCVLEMVCSCSNKSTRNISKILSRLLAEPVFEVSNVKLSDVVHIQVQTFNVLSMRTWVGTCTSRHQESNHSSMSSRLDLIESIVAWMYKEIFCLFFGAMPPSWFSLSFLSQPLMGLHLTRIFPFFDIKFSQDESWGPEK